MAADVIRYLTISHAPGEAATPGMAIRHRFRRVLEWTLEQERPDRMVVVTHSLGSVIAIDELTRDGGPADRLPDGGVELVTMGSPISHLFQHYFPEDYPAWNAPRWQPFLARVKRWTNIYRADDFVGTAIPDPGCGGASPPNLENHRVEHHGHTSYWTDIQVLDHLIDLPL